MAGVRTGAQGVLALGVGAGAPAAGERQRRWGAQASGTAWARGALAGARAWAAATRGERGGSRQAQAGALGAAGWAAFARLVCAAGPGWVFWCT